MKGISEGFKIRYNDSMCRPGRAGANSCTTPGLPGQHNTCKGWIYSGSIIDHRGPANYYPGRDNPLYRVMVYP